MKPSPAVPNGRDSIQTALEGLDTRAAVRVVASYLARNQEYPSAEKVRKFIGDQTGASPSTTTVQDEMKKWLADTFWPRQHAFGFLADQNGLASKLQDIYRESFDSLVVRTVDLVNSSWAAERERLESEVLQFESQYQQAAQAQRDIEEQRRELESRVRELEQRDLESEREKQQLRLDLGQLRGQMETLTAERTILVARMTAENDQIRSDLAQVRDNLINEKARVSSLERDLARSEAEGKASRDQLTTSVARVAEAEAKATGLEMVVAEGRSRIEQLMAEVAALRVQRAAAPAQSIHQKRKMASMVRPRK